MKSTIKLEVCADKAAHMSLTLGATPYIWIGGRTCFGCVPDKDVKKLRDWCDRILKKRSK